MGDLASFQTCRSASARGTSMIILKMVRLAMKKKQDLNALHSFLSVTGAATSHSSGSHMHHGSQFQSRSSYAHLGSHMHHGGPTRSLAKKTHSTSRLAWHEVSGCSSYAQMYMQCDSWHKPVRCGSPLSASHITSCRTHQDFRFQEQPAKCARQSDGQALCMTAIRINKRFINESAF